MSLSRRIGRISGSEGQKLRALERELSEFLRAEFPEFSESSGLSENDGRVESFTFQAFDRRRVRAVLSDQITTTINQNIIIASRFELMVILLFYIMYNLRLFILYNFKTTVYLGLFGFLSTFNIRTYSYMCIHVRGLSLKFVDSAA